jgi:hypothetical protein
MKQPPWPKITNGSWNQQHYISTFLFTKYGQEDWFLFRKHKVQTQGAYLIC